MATTLIELEARVAALEAGQADYKAVMSAVNVLSQQTRERFDALENALKLDIDEVRREADARWQETKVRFRSIDNNFAELKDLLVRVLNR
ncbi:hypothetical protein [Smaragdicoccus niigatensis]|uniref:hypothetical protein n=1 Tax=Smaragdicoccus niigatensis TaxID=359359 RepID=UPI00037F39F5|nr:hypothetical protein [Smaragdicoccus niigatensis]